MYNGQDQKQPVTIFDKEAGKELVEGTDYTLTYSDDVKNVGEVTITVTGKGNYSGTFTRTYKITPKPLTITADSDSKAYDGKTLTKDSYTDTGLATGDSFASVTVTGSQTEVGKSDNVPSDAKIVDADGQDMNANYEITYEKGELEVTPAKLPEDPDDPDDPLAQRFDVSQPDDVKYNGKEQKQPLTITDNETGKDLVEGTDYELTYSDDVTNAGEVTITVKGIGNYSGTFTRTYQITKREITLTSGSDRKLYDGTPLTKDGIEVSGDGFAEGEGADYDVFGSQTYVGESANDFSYTLWGSTEPVSTQSSNAGSAFAEAVEEKGVKPALIAVSAALADVGESEHKETKASNYEISMVPGTLTVTDEENGDRPDGVVTKTHEDKEYKLGETVVFTIQVTNIYDEAKTITITEQEGVSITSESVFANVQPGETVTATAEYVITEDDLIAGSFKNTAKASFDGEENPFDGEDEVTPEKPVSHMTVNKIATSTPKNGKAYQEGETVTYQITVVNDGNMTIRNVTVKDELTGDTWTVETLAPEAEETFTVTYKVTAEDAKKGKVVNVATATGTSDDPDTKDDVPVDDGKTEVPTEEKPAPDESDDKPKEPENKPPKTSDENNLPLWWTMLITSGIGAIGIGILGRRRREEEDEAA